MRSLLRWLARIAATVLVLAVAGIAAALITAHTAWGREQLRRRIEAALRDALPGGARVAALDGSVLGTLTLHAVELDGLDRRPLVTAGALHVRVALWPLVVRTARLDRLIAEDVAVFVRDRPSAAAPAAPGGAPSPWRLELPDVALHRVAVAIEPIAVRLDELEAGGALRIAGERVDLQGSLRGRWSRAGHPAAALAATATVVLDRGVRVPAAQLALDGASLAASDLVVDVDHPAGALRITAPAAAIARLVPELAERGAAVPGDVTAAIEVSPDEAATRLTITASSGDARLWLALCGEPARRTARGLVSVTAIDLARATRERLAGRGNLLAGFDAGADGVRGAVIAAGDVARADAPVRRAAVALFGGLDAATAVVLAGGDDALDLAAAARGHRAAGRITLDDARAVATAQGVALPCATGARCRHATGNLAARARAAGTLAPVLDVAVAATARAGRVTIAPDGDGSGRAAIAALRTGFVVGITGGAGGDAAGIEVAVTGQADGAGLAYDDLRIAAASGRFSLVAPRAAPGARPGARLDTAHLVARGVRRAGRLLGDARLDLARRGDRFDLTASAWPAGAALAVTAQAAVAPAGAAYHAAIGPSRVTLADGTVWSGRGGQLTVAAAADPSRMRIALSDVRLHDGDAAIAISGDYTGATGDLAVRITADRVAASSISLPARGRVRGAIDLARRGGRWQGHAALAGDGLAVTPDAQAVDATAELTLARGRAALEAHATGEALGGIAVAIDVAAPRDPLDLTAWYRLDPAAIHRAELTARQVALPGLAALAGRTAQPLAGTLDGNVELAPASPHGELAVRGIASPLGTLDGSLAVARDDGGLTARAAVQRAGAPAADLTVRLAVPPHPFDPATWRHRGRDLVQGATATLAALAFDPDLLARIGADRWLAGSGVPAVRGRIGARLTLDAGATTAGLAIDLDDVTGGALVAPVSQRVALTAGPAATHVRAELHGGELALGAIEGDIAMPLERWLAEPLAALYTPFTAQWTLPATPLPPLLALLGRRSVEAGTIEGSATLRGSFVTPIIPAARVVAHGVRIAAPLGGRPPPVLAALEARARWSGSTGSFQLHGREVTGGELDADASGSLDAPAATTATAHLRRFDIAPIAALLPGALVSAAGVVDGDVALRGAGRVTGALRITGGALPLAPAIGTLRDADARIALDDTTATAVVDGKLGRGTVHLEAEAPAAGLATATARLRLRNVSPIAALRPAITAELTARLRRTAGQLRGDATVERGSIVLPEHAGTPLLDAALPADLVIAGAATPAAGAPHAPAHPWLILDLRFDDLRFGARELAEDLGATGALSSDRLTLAIGDGVAVTGQIDVTHADVDLLGRRYTVIEPSFLRFEGGLDPELHLSLSYRFPELTLGVAVTGAASRPELQLSGDTGSYTQDQLFGFLLGGEPAADPTSQTRSTVTSLGTRLASGRLGKQISKLLPVEIDSLSCEPAATATAGSTATASGSCTVGKWVSRRIFLAYRQHLQPTPDENNGDVQLQVRLSDQLRLEGTGGDRNIFGGDLVWQHRW